MEINSSQAAYEQMKSLPWFYLVIRHELHSFFITYPRRPFQGQDDTESDQTNTVSRISDVTTLTIMCTLSS